LIRAVAEPDDRETGQAGILYRAASLISRSATSLLRPALGTRQYRSRATNAALGGELLVVFLGRVTCHDHVSRQVESVYELV
jgi:hypothetical protein